MTAAAVARFSGVPGSVGEARRFVAGVLGKAYANLCDEATVAVSELASNAVLHCVTDFTVSVEEVGGGVRVTVTDHGTGKPTVRQPGPTDLHGRGLRIVSELSDAWGVAPAETGDGKSVWFELRVRRH